MDYSSCFQERFLPLFKQGHYAQHSGTCSSTRLKGKVKATSVPPAATRAADEKRLRATSKLVRGPLLFERSIRLLESGLHSCCVFVLAEEGWRCPKCQSPCWNQRSLGTVMVPSQPALTTSFGPHTEKLQIWPLSAQSRNAEQNLDRIGKLLVTF